MKQRLFQIANSFQSLPTWVQVWVGLILIPINVVPFFMLGTWTGNVAAIASLVVAATILPIMWLERGMSKLMAIPHLLAWIPLEIALALRVMGHAGTTPMTAHEYLALLLIMGVNGISLWFDTLDALRWCQGDRSISGHPL